MAGDCPGVRSTAKDDRSDPSEYGFLLISTVQLVAVTNQGVKNEANAFYDSMSGFSLPDERAAPEMGNQAKPAANRRSI